MSKNSPTVLHDEGNGKFYVPFSDKQAVLRYQLDEDEKQIKFLSIFVPPSLRSNGLGEEIIQSAYSYAEEQALIPEPATAQQFIDGDSAHI